MVKASGSGVIIQQLGPDLWALDARLKEGVPVRRVLRRLNDACQRLARHFSSPEPPSLKGVTEWETAVRKQRGEKRFFRPHCLLCELWIVPLGQSAQTPPGCRRMEMEAGKACGTGHHPTTQCCLRLLRRLCENGGIPSPVLDVGTGTGIMAMVAVLWGAERVVAIDINPHAISVARRNARQNGLKERIDIHCRDVLLEGGSYPLVLANLSMRVIQRRARALIRCVSHQGHLILGGIWKKRKEQLLPLFCPPMELVSMESQAWWCSLLLRRKE